MMRSGLGIVLFMCLFTVLSTARADLNTGLVAYYPFDGNANDESGNGNNGTVHGASFDDERIGGAKSLRFNGTASTYVCVPRSASLEPPDAMTISLWCKGAPGSYYGTVIRKANHGQNGFLIRKQDYRQSDSPLTFLYSYFPSDNYWSTFSTVNESKWMHLAITYSYATGRIVTYVDGAQVDSTNITFHLYHTGDLYVGGAAVHDGADADGGFLGLIDDVRIYNRTLSSNEIVQLFTQNTYTNQSPVVSNVRASQRAQTNLVDVFYDLSATNSGSFSVAVAVSTNNGSAYDLPASSLTGNGIGSVVTVGKGKRVVWDAGHDWPGQYSSAIRFRVTAVENTAPSGMVLIPAGTNTGTDPDFGAYSLTNSAPFYMDKYEVTKAQWDVVYVWATNNGYLFRNNGSGKAANHPVYQVNWYDCLKWCNARSEKEGRAPAYYMDSAKSIVYRVGETNIENNCVNGSCGYRLPTTNEWMYAARGGVSSRRFPWGDTDTIQHGRANYYSDSSYSYDTSLTRGSHPIYNDGVWPYTSPVGSFSPNGYGVFDMAGNVWEWCWNWYSIEKTYGHVVRGGGWHMFGFAPGCRISQGCRDPDTVSSLVGVRAILQVGQ